MPLLVYSTVMTALSLSSTGPWLSVTVTVAVYRPALA